MVLSHHYTREKMQCSVLWMTQQTHEHGYLHLGWVLLPWRVGNLRCLHMVWEQRTPLYRASVALIGAGNQGKHGGNLES